MRILHRAVIGCGHAFLALMMEIMKALCFDHFLSITERSNTRNKILMKCQRPILSSGSSSDEASYTKPLRKEVKMAEHQKCMEDVKEVTLKDVFVQLSSMKRDMDTSFTAVNENMEHIKHQLRNDIKLLRDDLEEIKTSLNNAWEEVDNIKGNMAAASVDIVGMKSEIQILKDQLKVEKDRNVKLEQYTCCENIHLLNVAEGEDEDTEALFIKVLVEMGIETHNIKFHAVHRVCPPRDQRRKCFGNKPPLLRHIIARFLSCKNRNYVWENRGKLKGSENYKEAFFVPDLAKEYAQEGYVLRPARKLAKEKYNIQAEIKSNKLVMPDSGLAYSANGLPEYLKVK